MTDTELKIASAQYPIDQLSSLSEWENKISDWVQKGAATGANLLVFPEYAAIELASCFGPGIYSDLQKTLHKIAETATSRLHLHLALARKYNVHILVGSGPIKKSDGRFVNAAQLVTPSGLVGEQEKIIMTPFEQNWGITSGGPLRVFQTAIAQIGILICYDSEFPLLARALAEADANLLLVPSCTERLSGHHRVKTGCMARALENTVAVVQSPTVGEALWSPAVDHNQGAAGFYVPSDQDISDTGILCEGAVNQPQWVSANLDLHRLKKLRASGEMRNFSDWSHQQGSASLSFYVEKISLL